MKRRSAIHTFVDDPDAFDPHSGERWCKCGRKEKNVAHDLPARSDVERSVEARRVGERDA